MSVSVRCKNNAQRTLLTMTFFPVSGDVTGEPWLEPLLRWRQADRPHLVALFSTFTKFGLQLHQGCKTITDNHSFD